MRNLTLLIGAFIFLAGCTGMSTTDGDSTKTWVKIESSRTDLDGKVLDVCYRLDVRFSPPQAAGAINTDMSCITKCCWYSERKQVTLNMNESFARSMQTTGAGTMYTPDKVIFNMSYSSFLKTIHARVEPRGVIKSGGLVQLKSEYLQGVDSTMPVANEPVTAMVYDESAPDYSGTYLFKKPNSPEQLQQQAAPAPEAAYIPAEEAAKQEALDADEAKARADLLQLRITYEREQAIALLKRFYNKNIDAYVMAIDKEQREKGLTLLANDRTWTTTKIGTPIFRITCRVNGKLGKTMSTMKPAPIDCGTYEVDLEKQTVKPYDAMAKNVLNF